MIVSLTDCWGFALAAWYAVSKRSPINVNCIFYSLLPCFTLSRTNSSSLLTGFFTFCFRHGNPVFLVQIDFLPATRLGCRYEVPKHESAPLAPLPAAHKSFGVV